MDLLMGARKKVFNSSSELLSVNYVLGLVSIKIAYSEPIRVQLTAYPGEESKVSWVSNCTASLHGDWLRQSHDTMRSFVHRVKAFQVK